MKTEVSTAGKALQRSVMWISRRTPSRQQWGLGDSHLSCTPLPCQAVLSQASCCLPLPESTAGSSMLPLAKVTQKLARILLLLQWFCLTAPSFLAGKEASVVIGGGDSGRQPGQRCFAVEQSWAIDPGSTLELNLEVWRHKNPFWYINLIFCMSQCTQLCSLNQFWTKHFYLSGSTAGRSSFLAKQAVFEEIWDWSVGAASAFYRQGSSLQVLFVWFCSIKPKYLDLKPVSK